MSKADSSTGGSSIENKSKGEMNKNKRKKDDQPQEKAVRVKPKMIKPYQVALVWFCRILVGAVFITSGIAKCIDPWGFVYKIQDYLNVWEWNVAYSYVVVGAFAMAIIEFTIGVMTLLGNFRRLSIWGATLMMMFLLPLTVYIYIVNPVSDCGCFGDMIVISNGATLAKNIIVSAALVYLLLFNPRVESVYTPYVQWITLAVTMVYAFVISLYGYSVQPVLDFRPFPVGLDVSKIATEANEPKFEFLYKQNGGPAVAFDEDNLPSEEDGWEFVDRVPLKGTDSQGESADFAVFDNGGDDVTIDIFDDPELTSNLMVALIPDVSKADLSCSWLIRSLSDYLHTQGGELITIGNQNTVYAPTAQYYTADATAIKQMARGHVALVYIKDGVIQWKRTASSLTTDLLDQLEPEEEEDVLMEIEPRGERLFWGVTILYVIFMGVFYVITTAAMSGWRMRQRALLRKRLNKIKLPLESLSDNNPAKSETNPEEDNPRSDK